jgi:hypothetical protein
MNQPDPKTTLREFHEYVASSHESHSKIAARIGVSQWAIWNWLTGKQPPAARSLVRLPAFLDAEAKRPLQGVEWAALRLPLCAKPLQGPPCGTVCRPSLRTPRFSSFQGFDSSIVRRSIIAIILLNLARLRPIG